MQSANLSSNDRSTLIEIIAACADIPDYDAEETDRDELMRRVLYTHRNFMWLTDIPPGTQKGYNNLNLCRSDYITDAMRLAFRIEAESPSVSMLTNLGYCYNNGMYYWSGGYTKYYSTQVHDIINAYYTDNNTLIVTFTDTYIEADAEPVNEKSTASFRYDSDGWYLTSIHMGSDAMQQDTESGAVLSPGNPILPIIHQYLPWLIALLALAGAGIVIYICLLGRHH
ncbi:MAG: hypothetical protein J1G06_10670 [Oscillospiraceae bacterium]|nr:hypothetical protein [Oscillospiraceae bacterium]